MLGKIDVAAHMLWSLLQVESLPWFVTSAPRTRTSFGCRISFFLCFILAHYQSKVWRHFIVQFILSLQLPTLQRDTRYIKYMSEIHGIMQWETFEIILNMLFMKGDNDWHDSVCINSFDDSWDTDSQSYQNEVIGQRPCSNLCPPVYLH